ncbi:sigma-70 family RNA polymerase sigma factor [Luteimonas kalidii]|uniref:Sigma-70 family RNA polymerase sigma factor n=1 Tax=Luteimonas kalidii TaxID=3042025 RepID=A0ABT6JVA1_9GAMM|nr:sigma-70 family RNA polymerase sigma factor [Luteimonas kalidii]MDH5834608.1 sigma-70 family RNA polymerase sigma factor [Luteimonas kalidii]
MRAALDGDQAAYATLLHGLDGWLRSYFRSRLPAAAVDDAVQEALIAVHEKRHTYRPGLPVLPWVAAIARYKWIDWLRALPRNEDPLLDELADIPRDAPAQAVVDLEALLARLKPAQARVIRLVKLQGFSVAEASRRTGQSESLVKVNIHRGLALLSRQVRDAAPDTGACGTGPG